MEYSDLLKIIANCRGVKKVTLHFMMVTPEILKAIGRTSVETLVISNCEVRNELNDVDVDNYLSRFRTYNSHYHSSIALEFQPFEEKIVTSNSYMLQLQKFSKDVKLTKQTNYFQYLKTVVFLDTPFYALYPKFITSEIESTHLYQYMSHECELEHFEIPSFEYLDIDNIKTRPFVDDTPASTSTFGYFSSLSPNNPKKMVALKRNDRLVNILCITNGFIQAQTIVNGQYIDYVTIDPLEHEKCYEFFMRNRLPFNLKTRVSFVGSCKNLSVFRKFVTSGYMKLLDVDINDQTVLFSALDRAYETSPGFTGDSYPYQFFNWKSQLEISSLISTIKWIHETPEILAQLDQNGAIFKEYVSTCKNMDKRWKNYFSKFKNDINSKIDWEHFIKTGEEQAPTKKRKQASTSTANVENPSKKR